MSLDITTNKVLDTIFSETSLPSYYRKSLEEGLALRKHTPTPEFARLLQSVAKLEKNEQVKILAAIILAGSELERGRTAADRQVSKALGHMEDLRTYSEIRDFHEELARLATSNPDAFARQAFGRFCERYLTQEAKYDDRKNTGVWCISENEVVDVMMLKLRRIPASSLETLRTEVLELLSHDNIGKLSNYARGHVAGLASQFSTNSALEIGEQLLQGCKQPHIARASLDSLENFCIGLFTNKNCSEIVPVMATKGTAILDQIMASDKEVDGNIDSSICFKAWEVFNDLIYTSNCSLGTQIERPTLSFDAQEALLRRIERSGKRESVNLPPVSRYRHNGFYDFLIIPIIDCRHPDLSGRVATLLDTQFKERDGTVFKPFNTSAIFVLMHHEREGRQVNPEHLEKIAGGIDFRGEADLLLVTLWPRLAAQCSQNITHIATSLANEPRALYRMLAAFLDDSVHINSDHAIGLQELFENRVKSFKEASYPYEKAKALQFLEKKGLMTSCLIYYVCNHMLSNVKATPFLAAGCRAITSKPELLLANEWLIELHFDNETLCEKVFNCLDRTHSFGQKGGKPWNRNARGEALIDAYSYLVSSPAFVERYYGQLRARLASLAIGNYSDEITSKAEKMLKSIV